VNRHPETVVNESFLREAITLALESVRTGGGPFGAVIVRDGQIIGRGANRVTVVNDPTAHAEIVAIREACRLLNTFSLRGRDVYASCEPCPVCLAALYWARVGRVYFASTRADAAAVGFDDEYLYQELARPIDERRLPMTQRLRDEAQAALDAWRASPFKIPY
jgi:tRNA(Arg) A34 adenosine deaminase TadA